MKTPLPSRGEREEAKRYPNGFVYRISGLIDPNGFVLPKVIAGAWKVDAFGNIVEEFIPTRSTIRSNGLAARVTLIRRDSWSTPQLPGGGCATRWGR
jgi:hypothetical protein